MWTRLALGTALTAALLAGCGSSDSPAASSSSPAATNVVVGLYPLEWLTTELQGANVAVTSLVAPGIDPHDVELTAAQMATVQDADLVIVVPGLQPALDDAVAALDPAKVLDITQGLTLIAGAGHEDDQHAEEDQDHGAMDPHVWLDPQNMITMAKTIASRINADAANVVAELEQLDADFSSATAQCMSRDLVVSHAAFGYLANAYNFTQWAVSSSPDVEPTPRDIADIAEFVRSSKVTTIFTEPLIDPAIAQTIASETGVKTATLDPLENITEGNDYLSVMRKNLAAIQAGLSCAQ